MVVRHGGGEPAEAPPTGVPAGCVLPFVLVFIVLAVLAGAGLIGLGGGDDAASTTTTTAPAAEPVLEAPAEPAVPEPPEGSFTVSAGESTSLNLDELADAIERRWRTRFMQRLRDLERVEDRAHADVVGDAAVDEMQVRPMDAVAEGLLQVAQQFDLALGDRRGLAEAVGAGVVVSGGAPAAPGAAHHGPQQHQRQQRHAGAEQGQPGPAVLGQPAGPAVENF